ncbi:MAG: hypothetical protein J6Y32_02630 [Bacteroidales bacterium]|nr:hypothetical protein [Bacteroidales bacterium]
MKFHSLLKCAVAAMAACCAILSCSKDNAGSADGKKDEPQKRDRARYTVLIYGNAGARMDHVIEGTWEQLQPMLNARPMCVCLWCINMAQ